MTDTTTGKLTTVFAAVVVALGIGLPQIVMPPEYQWVSVAFAMVGVALIGLWILDA